MTAKELIAAKLEYAKENHDFFKGREERKDQASYWEGVVDALVFALDCLPKDGQ